MKKFKIYKYLIPEQVCKVFLHTNAKIINVDYQGDGNLYMWAEVDPEEEMTEVRVFSVIGTGHIKTDPVAKWYLKTVYCGSLVWHVYEVIR